MKDIKYTSGEQALLLDDDGCGFCYYPSGRTAVCISKVNSYQKRHYFYEDNRKKTLLCSIDENAVGSAGRSREGNSLVLTIDGGFLSDENQNLIKTWRWDPNSQNAGIIPTEPINIQLNSEMDFTFTNRQDIQVEYMNNGINLKFDCGEKLRRYDTYLDSAKRIQVGSQRGKLSIKTNSPNLIQRQKQVEIDSLAKRSKQKPRSEDIQHNDIKGVISTLESNFDSYEGHGVHPYADGSWRQEALSKTLSELPSYELTGTEVGKITSKLRSSMTNESGPELPTTNKRQLKTIDGKWLGSLEIRQKIEECNPVLKRSTCLINASGRYNVDVQVSGDLQIQRGRPLTRILGKNFDHFLKNVCEKDQVVLVACLREDNRESRQAERVLQIVNQVIYQGNNNEDHKENPYKVFRIVKFELSESNFLTRRYGVQTIPTFLIFYNGNLVHATGFGGMGVRVHPCTSNSNLTHVMNELPKTLLIEPNFKQQLSIEKVLRKESFHWDLAMNATESMSHVKRINSNLSSNKQDRYGLILMSDRLPETDIKTIERCICRSHPNQSSSGEGKNSSPLICVIYTSSSVTFSKQMCNHCLFAAGKRIKVNTPRRTNSSPTNSKNYASACPHCGIISDFKQIIPSLLCNIIDVVVYKHVKAATLHRLAERWHSQKSQNLEFSKKINSVSSTSKSSKTELNIASRNPAIRHDGTFMGLTCESIFQQLENSLSVARRGQFLPDKYQVGMLLSSTEVQCNGTSLTK